jgi:hypothetical protein
VASLHLGRKPSGLVQDPEPGPHGPLGIVLARFDGAEDRQQAVPGVLEDPAVLRLDDRREAPERAVHDGLNVLGLEPTAQPRGFHDIREQNRHRLELLLGYVEASEPGAQRGERRVDDRVTQDGALGLQGGDAAFELFPLRHAPVLRSAASVGHQEDERAHVLFGR